MEKIPPATVREAVEHPLFMESLCAAMREKGLWPGD